MEKRFSKHWIKSKQPRKQRKYRFNAPLNIKGKFLNCHLSKELRKKYQRRNMRVRKGDTIKIARGSFKGKTGKVERVNVKKTKVYIVGIELIKKDGTKTVVSFEPSNLIITELIMDDKRRKAKLNARKETAGEVKNDKKPLEKA